MQGGAGGEFISMGFGCLREDAPAVAAMFSDVITDPALPQQRIDLYKSQARHGQSRPGHTSTPPFTPPSDRPVQSSGHTRAYTHALLLLAHLQAGLTGTFHERSLLQIVCRLRARTV